MRITVYPPYRNAVGRDLLEMALPPGATVRDLLEALGREYAPFGPLARARSNEFLWGQLIVHVNDEIAGLETELRADDRLDLLPPIAGGACGMAAARF